MDLHKADIFHVIKNKVFFMSKFKTVRYTKVCQNQDVIVSGQRFNRVNYIVFTNLKDQFRYIMVDIRTFLC